MSTNIPSDPNTDVVSEAPSGNILSPSVVERIHSFMGCDRLPVRPLKSPVPEMELTVSDTGGQTVVALTMTDETGEFRRVSFCFNNNNPVPEILLSVTPSGEISVEELVENISEMFGPTDGLITFEEAEEAEGATDIGEISSDVKEGVQGVK